MCARQYGFCTLITCDNHCNIITLFIIIIDRHRELCIVYLCDDPYLLSNVEIVAYNILVTYHRTDLLRNRWDGRRGDKKQNKSAPYTYCTRTHTHTWILMFSNNGGTLKASVNPWPQSRFQQVLPEVCVWCLRTHIILFYDNKHSFCFISSVVCCLYTVLAMLRRDVCLHTVQIPNNIHA